MRTLTYSQAILEAHNQLLSSDNDVFVIGQGLWSPWYVGRTMKDLDKTFGKERIIDSPVSENATTGAALGCALAGMRPIVVHPRMDFMLLALDQIVNQAANWSYMFNGKANAPLVIRSIINRGGEQGAQHSQAYHSWLAHIPGLKVVMPSTAYDAKGLFISSIYDGNPVVYIDDRWLYDVEDEVPEEMYKIPIGKGAIRREGKDVTIVGLSFMALQAELAAKDLESEGIDAEVIDLRSFKPFDEEIIFESVAKTGRLVVADSGWGTCGIASEVAARVAGNKVIECLKAPIKRVTLPETPAPMSLPLENEYYPKAANIISAVKEILN